MIIVEDEKGTTRQRVQVASRNWKGQGISPLMSPEERALLHFDFSSEDPFSDL
jgi:hypothetical protein